MKSRTLATLPDFPILLGEIKARIRLAQTRAVASANAELVRLYWDIGRLIDTRQQREGWGAAVIPRLSRELRNELPEIKGFSERNIKSMLAFFRAYPDATLIVQQPAAQLRNRPAPRQKPVSESKKTRNVQQAAAQTPPPILWAIPWIHHVTLMEKVKDANARFWYMRETLSHGWSRNVLLAMIQSQAHRRQGKATTNFERLLPPSQSDLARQALKDPYIFDFLTLEEPFHERELETGLLKQVERFLLELGQGFAFVGRQFHLDVGDSDFYLDLLFYHLKLRCYFVIDLKKGAFKPEHAGKMNFYLTAVDERLRHAGDVPSIGLILCQDRNHVIAEYALRDVNKPIGVSAYELTRALPITLQSALPTIEEIEEELDAATAADAKQRPTRKKTSPRRPSAKPRKR
ncbi:MAG: DUF1016 family protein [Phycisphaerales bacterium]|nr:DUF1016 family protein [Phycisphaerales bacterium]